jgi:Uma2 family endonuclease
MASLRKTLYTPEQYLEIERAAEYKSEYISGEMVAMSGTTFRHGVITVNIATRFSNQLGGKPCQTLVSDIRVQCGAASFYPDVVVVCGEPHLVQDSYLDTLLNPSIIVEVLSRSTENYDRGIKFMRYAQIPTLADYILVSQDECRVEHFSRLANGEWPRAYVYTAEDDVIELKSIGCTLSVSDIYSQITFD